MNESMELHKFQKLLERSIVRDRSIKFFPEPHWKWGKNFIGWATLSTVDNRQSRVNPLPDGTSTQWEPEKKDPLRGSFFSYRPLAGAHRV